MNNKSLIFTFHQISYTCRLDKILVTLLLSFINLQDNKKSGNKKHCVKIVRIWSDPGLHFPAFGLCILSECRKLRTRITLNTDNFYAVKVPYSVNI